MYAAPRERSNALAVAALVVAIIALLGVVVVGIMLAVTTLGGAGEPLTGRVSGVSAGSPLTGATLAGAVTTRIHDDGGHVDQITCPDLKTVAQGTVTVCHATIDGGNWAVVVFFEDAQGTYTLNPI